jgi:hypothetical protein
MGPVSVRPGGWGSVPLSTSSKRDGDRLASGLPALSGTNPTSAKPSLASNFEVAPLAGSNEEKAGGHGNPS